MPDLKNKSIDDEVHSDFESFSNLFYSVYF